MKKPIRTPLTPEQLADAERLRAIYKRRVSESRARGDQPALNQTEVGERCEWKSPQSAVSQYLNGNVALNLDALLRLAKALDFDPSDVSPTLAQGVRIATQGFLPEEDDTIDLIPIVTAKAAAGMGYSNSHVETKQQWPFAHSWVKANRLDASSLAIITAFGNSMQPTISDQDQILVDISVKQPAENDIFVLNSPTAGVIVKRLVKAGNGSWVVRSDNPDKATYPDICPVEGDWDDLQIIGRVVWRGGDVQ